MRTAVNGEHGVRSPINYGHTYDGNDGDGDMDVDGDGDGDGDQDDDDEYDDYYDDDDDDDDCYCATYVLIFSEPYKKEYRVPVNWNGYIACLPRQC